MPGSKFVCRVIGKAIKVYESHVKCCSCHYWLGVRGKPWLWAFWGEWMTGSCQRVDPLTDAALSFPSRLQILSAALSTNTLPSHHSNSHRNPPFSFSLSFFLPSPCFVPQECLLDVEGKTISASYSQLAPLQQCGIILDGQASRRYDSSELHRLMTQCWR